MLRRPSGESALCAPRRRSAWHSPSAWSRGSGRTRSPGRAGHRDRQIPRRRTRRPATRDPGLAQARLECWASAVMDSPCQPRRKGASGTGDRSSATSGVRTWAARRGPAGWVMGHYLSGQCRRSQHTGGLTGWSASHRGLRCRSGAEFSVRRARHRGAARSVLLGREVSWTG